MSLVPRTNGATDAWRIMLAAAIGNAGIADPANAPLRPTREGPACRAPSTFATSFPADQNLVLSGPRKLDPVYACAEVLWYLSHSSVTTMIEAYAPQYRTAGWCDDAGDGQ